MIRLLATSDWHLGNVFKGFDRQAEHAHFLAWLLEVVERERPDALLVAGDVFDNSNPSAAAQKLYFDFLERVTGVVCPGLQVVIIAGNHDSAARLEAPRRMLGRQGVQVRGLVRRLSDGSPDFSDLLIPVVGRADDERAWVMAVPYLRDGDFNRGLDYGEGTVGFIRSLVAFANQARRPGEALILLAHLYATGAEIAEEPSERLIVGGSEMVNMGALADAVTMAIVGHIHKRQRIGGSERMRYPGSALPMSFGERGYRHGADLWTLREGRLDEPPRFIPYQPLRPLLSLSAEPLPLDAVQAKIAALPDRADESGADYPYLEVKVLLDAPDPTLGKRLSEALELKAVLLCRAVPYYQMMGEVGDEALESMEDLLEKDPLDVIRVSYRNRHHCEMRDELVALARQAIEAARKEEEQPL